MGMPLSSHASGGGSGAPGAPGFLEIAIWEGGGYMSRRAIWYLIFGQVFERHPKLNLVLAEQYQGWWSTTLVDLDRMCDRFAGPMFLDGGLKKRPSEYMLEHVYLGASFPDVAFVQEAVELGYTANVIWGSDYPHLEGTYQFPTNAVYPDDSDEHLVTRTALRHVFSQVPTEDAVMMAGLNGVRAYGLDAAELAQIATRIGAVTIGELSTPPHGIPEVPAHCNAFRGPFNAH
jgi:predicted TIM-barrel fold metal-dependent hydrolase